MQFVRRALFSLWIAGLLFPSLSDVCAQAPQSPETPLSAAEIKAAAGSVPDSPGQRATDLNAVMTQAAIVEAMRRVADWQIAEAQGKWNQDWTYAPLYLGLLATSRTTNDKRYHDAVLQASESFHWKLWANRPFHADDEAIGQAYEALYAEKPQPIRLAGTRATLDALLEQPADPARDLWWWCDALFMGPPTMARLAAITGDHRFLDRMNAEWALTQQHLYDPAQHLFSRDASYLDKKEANGQKLFWSRGNGWVLAGTANVLQALPRNEPSRAGYERLFKEMAARVAALQGGDGLWRAGLLDQGAYKQPEVSGTAFFTYAMAWGINHGLLDRKTYQPVVERAWKGMIGQIYADGRLGSIQPIGGAPDTVVPSSSYVYGVGAFLLAGSELHQLAGR